MVPLLKPDKYASKGTNRFSSNMAFILERQLLDNAEIGIKITYKYANDPKIYTFLDIKLIVCEALDSIQAMPMIRKLFLELMSSSNLPCNCPIKGNILYSMSDFILTEDTLPAYTPIISFNYTVGFYESKALIGRMVVQGSTLPKKQPPLRKVNRKSNTKE
ncbi:uncharacterized protein [Musca autumnalis]|uniref:uncharacterized protein n=1 Tax=Musca autumnalis TaxID=221902 RepID=UPI003CEFDCFB